MDVTDEILEGIDTGFCDRCDCEWKLDKLQKMGEEHLCPNCR